MILIRPPLDALDVEYALLQRVYRGFDLYLASEYGDNRETRPEFTSLPTSHTRGFETVLNPNTNANEVLINREEFNNLIDSLSGECQAVCNLIYPANLVEIN